jgi:tryptophan halogenase
MGRTLDSIVIAGGGTAGWLAASYLSWATRGKPAIHLIEPSAIGPIGVGEATVPTLRETLRLIGLSEPDWMRACDATFKLAIKFVGWSGNGPAGLFWHPFGGLKVPRVAGLGLTHHWLRRSGETAGLAVRCFPSVALCEQRRAPRAIGDAPYQGEVDYAYHLDAIKFARYLKAHASARGVRAIEGKIVEVRRDDRGFLTAAVLADGEVVAGDFFVDCTGFRSVLLGETLGEPFESYGESLLCDAAVAMGVPHSSEEPEIEPFTTATAMPNGWIWQIPLFTRSGTGYVYSSAHLSRDEAEAELRRFLGPRSAEQPALHIAMRVGKRRRLWVNNCVAIGLAGGFVEPLESTGIYLIEMGLHTLATYFPDPAFDDGLARQYNRVMTRLYEHVRDFIVLHYCTTRRDDSEFWRRNRTGLRIPASLAEKLPLWRTTFPLNEGLYNPGLFPDESYACILAGMVHLPERPPPLLEYGPEADAEEEFLALERRGARLLQRLPSHRAFLDHLHGVATARMPQ